MSAPSTGPLTGDALLAAVTDAMVALHERYHHREPVTAKTMLLGGDLLACLMGGLYTDVEKTMIELRRVEPVAPDQSTSRKEPRPVPIATGPADRVEQVEL